MMSLFISYRRKDIDQLQPLLDALKVEGVEYWLDTRDIEPFTDFSDAIVGALSSAGALLAWYSRDYPESRACQWEFTAAFLTAQQEADPLRRVLVINPETGDDHLLLPQEIRGQNIRPAPAPGDAAGFKTLAQEIARHLNQIASPFGQIKPGEKPPYFGRKITHSERFVGRLKEFWNIHWALHNGSDRTITASAPVHLVQLIGLGGMGKSMFTEEYAARYGWAYPGGIFWLDAYGADGKTPESMELFAPLRHQQLEGIARELGIDLSGQDMALLPSAIRRKLEVQGKPYLWIVDDLPPCPDLRDLDQWLAPDTAHGKSLITTRTTTYRNRGTPINLDRLDPNAAYRLLNRNQELADPLEIEAAKGIVSDLGGHPLALELAAASMESYAGMMTFAEYRQMLADPSEDALKLAEEFVDLLPNGHEKSIAATMHHSLKQLGEEGLDFLRLAAQLSPAPIPASLVFSTFAHADGLEEAKAKLRAAQAFNQTEKHSLAQVVEPQQGLRIVHALVSRVIRFDGEHAPRCQALRTAVVQALNAVLHEVDDIRTHNLLEHQVSHARELVKQMETEDDATLGGWVAQHDYARGDYSSARMLEERVLNLRQTLLGEEHPDTFISMNNLAATLRAQGDLSGARALHEKGREFSLRVLGEEHPNTLTSMSNLAETFGAQGDLPGARILQEKTLAIRRRVQGEEHPATLSSMNNLAATFWRQGDLSGARALHEKGLEICRRVLGEEHSDTLTFMNNLAETLRGQGDLPGARVLQEKTLAIRRRVLGEEHPDTLTSMNNLAEILGAQGAYPGARALQEKAFGIRRRVLGEEHPATLSSMNNLAATLRAQGDLPGARVLHERTLGIYRRVLGEEHPDTLTSMNNLAVTLWAQRDLPGARALHEKELDICRRVRGEAHPDTSISAFNLYGVLMKGGAQNEAFQIFQSDLSWLLKRDPTSLGADQRNIREQLEEAVKSRKAITSKHSRGKQQKRKKR